MTKLQLCLTGAPPRCFEANLAVKVGKGSFLL